MGIYNYNIDGQNTSQGPPPYSYATREDAAAAKQAQTQLSTARAANGSAGIVVLERMDTLNNYAQQAFSMVTTKVAEITAFANALAAVDTSPIGTPTVTFTGLTYDARPMLGDVAIPTDWPVNSTAPLDIVALPSFTPGTFPVLSVVAPVYTSPTAPTPGVYTEPVMTPLAAITTPTAPSITLPDVPAFTAIVLPAAPTITLPVFSATIPSMTIDAPGVFTWGEPAYNSDLWADLLGQVLANIRSGGTGLDAAVESELYQRHLDRTFSENEKMYHETENYFAARGFTLPPGALVGALNEINQQITRNNLNASRDITISQAELAQKNQQFILEMGAKLEGMIRDFYTQNSNRVLEASKVMAENAIAIYDSKVKLASLSMEGFKAEAAVYESRVRGALVAVEIFKGQIEGAKVTADVQKGLVDVYQAQIEAAEAMMKLYVSEMEGAKIASELEMTKVERYKVETQVYIAKQEVEKNKIALYEANLRGETVKAETYKAQVSAYGAIVDAYGKELDAKLKSTEFVLRMNQIEVERYRAELSAYETEVRAKASEISAVVDGFQAETAAYIAEGSAQEAYYRTKIEDIKAQVSLAEFNMRKAVAEVEATVRGYEAIKTLQLKGMEGIMNVGAQLTASALNAVNASASIGYSASSSQSSSSSESRSNSISDSTSHNYDM